MNKINIRKAQEVLLTCMCTRGQLNYDTVKGCCEYLNLQYNLLIEEHPAWYIFLPLFMTGNVDFCGNNFFKVTEPVAIWKKDCCIYTNVFNQPQGNTTQYPFIFKDKDVPNIKFSNVYEFNPISILKHFPIIGDIVCTFEKTPINDFSMLDFVDNPKVDEGIAKHNLKYYFVYSTRKVVGIPSWKDSPDAINIAYCYGRSIDGRGNGYYNADSKTLYVNSFRFPIMLYRVLLMESLLEGGMPTKENGMYVFPNMSSKVVKEVNRILNKSIRYE